MAVDLMTWLRQVAAQVAHLWKYAAMKADVPTYAWATVETVGPPATVVLEHDESGSPRAVSANSVGYLEVGWRVRVECVHNRLTVVAAPDDRSVHYTTTNRHVRIGPDGDFEPILELIRDRPTGRHSALMYLQAATTPGLAWLLAEGDTNLATLRFNKDGIRFQDLVAGVTRYVAYQDDVTALESKVSALPATAAGTAGPITLTGTSVTYNVPFPTGRFATPPTVTTNLYSGTRRCRADNVTATGFRLVIGDTATMSGSAYVHWQAIAPH